MSGAGPDVARFDTSGSSAYASWAIANTTFARVGSANTVMGVGAATDLGIRSAGHIYFSTNGSNVRWQIDSTTGNLIAFSDNSFDIGANASANRARTIYAGTSFVAPVGSASAPGFTFAGDTNTGIYNVSADVLGVTAGGSQVQSWGVGTSTLTGNLTATGNLSVGIAGAHSTDYGITINNGSYSGSDGYISFKNGATATELARINMNQDGLLNIGTVNASAFEFKTSNVNRWQITSAGHHLPYADNTYDAGSTALRIRSGYFGTNVVIGYSTTTAAQLHVGPGSALSVRDLGASSITPQMVNTQTSGIAAISVGVNDGTNNRRAALVSDNTNGLWGLTNNYSANPVDFVIKDFTTTTFRLSPTGVATLYNNLLFGTDASFDVGGAAANRPRDINVSRCVIAGGYALAPILYATASVRVQAAGGFLSFGVADDVVLTREGPNILALRNGTAAQTFQINNSRGTGGADYNRASFGWSGNIFRILTEEGGADVASPRQLIIGTVGVASFSVATSNTTRWNFLSDGRLTPHADATYDIGGGSNQVRDFYLSRYLRIGGAAPAGVTNLATIQAFGNTWSVIGGNPLTDATAKVTAFGSLHYTNAEEPSTVFCTSIGSGSAALNIGGGTASGNAMMRLNFYTAANNTTTTGTPRWQIDEFGVLFPVTDAATDIGYSTQQIRDLYLSRYLRIGGAAPAGASGLATIQAFGNTWAMIGANVLTDATTKLGAWGIANYLSAEEPMTFMYGTSGVSGNTLYIGGGTSSGNAASQINFYTAADGVTVTGTNRWLINSSGHFLAAADNTYDIGASGANRPRSVYTGGTIYSGNGYYLIGSGRVEWGGRSIIQSPADGVLALYNNALTGFTGIKLGGVTSAFPYIKVYGANIGIRKADDSGYAELYASGFEATGRLLVQTATAITAGGSTIAIGVSSTGGFGIYAGSGPPTISAAKGSLYLRSDGSTTNDRMYVNTDGATTWTAVITAT